MGVCGHRAQLWLRAGDPTEAVEGAPPHPGVPVGLCQVQPLPGQGAEWVAGMCGTGQGSMEAA